MNIVVTTSSGLVGFWYADEEDPIAKAEIPVVGCVGSAGSRILVIDADDSLDIVIETATGDSDMTNREIIYSFLKEPEL